MDESKLLPESAHPPGQGLIPPERPEPLLSFVPLKLVLQPSGLALELVRPDMVIGRHSGVDVRLPLPDVSRRHCRFVFANGSWQVFDLDSLNGVYVNGVRVQEALLHHGDTVGIGGFQFEVQLTGSRSPATEPATAQELIKTIADSLPLPTMNLREQPRKAS